MRTPFPLLTLMASLAGPMLTASADPITIMPLGDSITVGVNSTDNTGYRYPLYSDLTSAGLSFKLEGSAPTTANPSSTYGNFFTDGDSTSNGYGHYQIDDILHNLNGNVQPAAADYNQGGDWLTGVNANPNIILLMIGTNDFLQQNYQNVDANILALVTEIHNLSKNSKILIGGTIPIKGTGTNPYGDAGQTTGYYPLVLSYDNYIKNTVINDVPNTMYVDQVDNFLNTDGTLKFSLYSSDGIHPDDAGYAAIANTWDAAILTAEAPEPGTLTLLGSGVVALIALAFRKRLNR